MTRTFVSTEEFDRQWSAMRLRDGDLLRLQRELLNNPQVGSVIQGTGKLRKMRFAFEGQGKSGSARVAYVDFLVCKTIYLISAYPKSKKENLSQEERNNLKKIIDIIEKNLG